MRILLDHNVPHGLRQLLSGWDVTTVAFLAWTHLRNGEFLAAAEEPGFDVLVTGDRNIRHQQPPPRRLAVIVLDTTSWRLVRSASAVIEHEIAATTASSPRYRKLILRETSGPSRSEP